MSLVPFQKNHKNLHYFLVFAQLFFHIYNKCMNCAKTNKSKRNYPYQYEDFTKLPTEIAQSYLDASSLEYSKFIIKERRFKKLIRISSIVPIWGIFLCDKYQHRWFLMNKSFVYFVNMVSFLVCLSLLTYLIIFAI